MARPPVPQLAACSNRYVDYLAGLLSGVVRINSAPLGLRRLVLVGAPQGRPAAGGRLLVRVYQGMMPIWTSAVCTVDHRAQYTVVRLVLGQVHPKCFGQRLGQRQNT